MVAMLPGIQLYFQATGMNTSAVQQHGRQSSNDRWFWEDGA